MSRNLGGRNLSEHELHTPHHAAVREYGLSQWVAIFTAIVATLGAIIAHESSLSANEAILYKNEAILKKTEASNQWSYYQQVSTKAHLMELAKVLAPQIKTGEYDAKLEKYAQQKIDLQVKANALEDEVKVADAHSASLRKPWQSYGMALTLLQIAISLASVSILTGRTWLFGGAGLAAASGAGYWLLALANH